MNKKVIALSTTFMLGLSSVVAIPAVKADTYSNIKSQRAGIQAKISKTNSTISEAQAQLAKLNEQVKRVDQAIIDNNNMITSTEKQIGETKSEVAILHAQIAILQDRIAKRNKILKERALSFQETGGNVSYLDVLLGATSFSDLVERIGAVSTMVEADQDLLKQSMADKENVEKKQKAVVKKLSDLNNMKTELVGMQAQIAEQKAQNDALKEQLKAQAQAGINQKSGLLQQDHSLALQETTIQDGQSNNQSDSNSSAGSSFKINLSSSVKGDALTAIRAGYKYIGNSVYVFGGGRTQSDIDNGRFDCSGFVHWALAQAGVSVGYSTDSIKNAGSQVSPSDMKPGDLVFFDTYKQDGHVGIYIGGGQFIGSQDSTGVAIANMTSGYWKEHFNGRVVRVF